jgi:hypothetical protein
LASGTPNAMFGASSVLAGVVAAVIRDKLTGVILFAGRVADPS